MTCSGCPQFPMWCTKDCFWEIDEDGKDGKCIGKPHFFRTCTDSKNTISQILHMIPILMI